jgi:hypothetical protein
MDPSEKIHPVVMGGQLSGYAACERVHIRIELRPSDGYRF